jgi:hypothetical protein
MQHTAPPPPSVESREQAAGRRPNEGRSGSREEGVWVKRKTCAERHEVQRLGARAARGTHAAAPSPSMLSVKANNGPAVERV